MSPRVIFLVLDGKRQLGLKISWHQEMFKRQNTRILILPWETFWVVGVSIKRFVKHLKLSVVE